MDTIVVTVRLTRGTAAVASMHRASSPSQFCVQGY